MNKIDTVDTGRKYSPSEIAREINNLLMIIQGNVSLMLQKVDSPSNQNNHERLKSIEEQIQRGAKLTALLMP